MKCRVWNINLIVFFVLLWHSSLHAQKYNSKSLWPDHTKLQYAGGIGFFSIGTGYINKKQWLEGDLFYGYVPKSVSSITTHILTAKASFFPFRPIGNFLQLKPLSIGLLANYTFGKQYFGFTPENYPLSYYSRPTAFRAAAFAGQQLNKKVKGKCIKSVGIYYEVITYDTDLLSYVNNTKTLNLDDIINIGMGLRVGF